MEGRVLMEGFVIPPEVTRVASWESAQNVSASPATEDAGATGTSKAAATLRRESDWNLARSYLDAARYEEALPVLERLFRAFPERAELGHSLFHCQLTLERHSEAEETLEVLLEELPAGIWSFLPRAELCLARKQMKEARSLVNQAWNLHPTHPEALRRLGLLLLRLREWSALAELAQQALKQDENEPLAWLGLAEAQLRKRLAAEAEEAALRAIGLNYYMPQAHFVLARAFIAQGKWQQARETMQILLRLQPANRVAATYAKRIGSQHSQPSTKES
jgi:tetratricopeptide (TPR) repeat protein